jgi:hypothetical protein
MPKGIELIAMRYIDMTRMHPDQDDTHKCHKCGFGVGIYPTGQRALAENPKMKITCVHCASLAPPGTEIYPAGPIDEIMQESRESFPVPQFTPESKTK